MNYATSFVVSKTNVKQIGYARIKLNSLLDPETDNLGKNKSFAGFAQVTDLYTYYKVIRSHIHVECENSSAVTFCVAMSIMDDTAAGTLADTMRVTDIGSRNRGMLRLVNYAGTSTREIMDQTVDIRQFWGVPQYAFDDNYSALMADNPARSVIAAIAIGEVADAVSVALSCTVVVKLTCLVELHGPLENIDFA